MDETKPTSGRYPYEETSVQDTIRHIFEKLDEPTDEDVKYFSEKVNAIGDIVEGLALYVHHRNNEKFVL